MQITEPTTMLTDYILAILCGYCAVRLWRQETDDTPQRSRRLLAVALAATALGAFAGGAAHGFRLMLSAPWHAVLWKVTVYAIGLTSFFFVAAVALSALQGAARRMLLALAAAQLALYAAWMFRHDDFMYVIYDYVPAMLVVLALQVIELARGRPSALWLGAGIVASFAGAAIQQSGFTLHRYFNHNDLYHVVQMGAVWLFLRGGILLRDR